MAKAKKELDEVTDEVTEIKEVVDVKPKVATKLYPLKKATKIGNEIKPIGYKIPLTENGYKFYKQKNIV